MAAFSCVAVLVLGNLAGAVVKGITGFGSAILNLCVWVVCTCIGIDSGTLQQAVLSECIASETVALPLLFMTNARQTCDWRLVSSLCIFGAVGAPIGAALLTYLQPRRVEFVMACVLLLVICLHCRVVQQIQKLLSPRTNNTQAASQCCPVDRETCLQHHSSCTDAGGSSGSLPAAHNGTAVSLQQQQQHVSISAVAAGDYEPMPAMGTVASSGACSPGVPTATLYTSTLSSSASLGAAVDAKATAVATVELQGIAANNGSSRMRASISPDCCCCCSDGGEGADVGCICVISTPAELSTDKCCCAEDEHSLLLPSKVDATSNVQLTQRQLASGCGAADSQCGSWLGCCRQAFRDWWPAASQPEQRRAIISTFLIGSAAGTASGIMGGMTGMGGPPTMLMYEHMKVPKETVRGSNAVLNVLQFRIIAYALLGAFSKDDIVIYLGAAVASMLGAWLGNRFAGGMNQATFSRVMVGLMVLCCVLMFASSAGLAGK